MQRTRPLRRQRLGRYVRVSRIGERDERLRSPEFQRRAQDVKATAIDAELVDFADELDVSGSKRNRAVLDSIVTAIEAGELDGVIVYNLSRLSRLKPRDRIELVERIEDAGGVIVSTCESFDPSTPEGRFQRDLFFSIARLEWERAAEGFAVAKANAIESGRPIKAVTPYGYRQAERGAPLELVDDEAELVAELFRMRAAGASYGECLARFEQTSGRKSYRQTMRTMLSNRTYLGELRYGREVELVNADAVPAVPGLDEELFEAVQAIGRERSRAHGRPGGGKALSMLAGIAKCAECGRGLVCSRTGSGRTRSYKCPNESRKCSARAQINADELDAYVIEELLEWAGPAADELVELELELDAAGARIVAEQRLAEAEARLLEWTGNLELEDENPTAYRARLDARAARVELRRGELAACGEASELERARGTVRETLTSDEYDAAERRRLIGVVLAAVVVRRTPRIGAPAVERAELIFSAPEVVVADHAPELGQQAAA